VIYLQFAEGIVHYIKKLNAACAEIEEQHAFVPYLQRVPLLLEDDLCGFFIDDADGSFHYQPATDAQQKWWEQFPR
jgi:hypothetical protein